MVISIFLAVDRCHVRGVPIQVRPSDSELVPVRIDPFPECFSRRQSLCPCRAIYTDEIRREPVAIASVGAASMVGSVIGRLEAGCDRLAIIIPEGTGYARRQACLFGRVQHMKELRLEIPIHAANDIVDHGHPGPFGGLGVLPRKILIGKCCEGLRDSNKFAPFPDGHSSLFSDLDGVFLGRASVNRPEVTIDTGVCDKTLVENFGKVETPIGVDGFSSRRVRARRVRLCYLLRWCFRGQRFR